MSDITMTDTDRAVNQTKGREIMGRVSRIKKPEKRNEYHGNHYVVNDEQVIFRPYETPTNEGRNEREINELVNITHNQLYDEFEAFRKQELNEIADTGNILRIITKGDKR